MPKLIAVRLPDDVIQRVEWLAAGEGRTKSQVIIRALREAFSIANDIAIPQHTRDSATTQYEALKHAAGMCVHGREAKFCIHCKLKG